jgi:hypothetical protein
MIKHLGESDRFPPLAHSVVEVPALGKSQHPEEAGHDDRESRKATALAEPIPLEQLVDSREELVGATILPRHEVGGAKVVVRRDAERQILELLADPERTLGECGRIRRVPGHPGVLGRVRGDPSEASPIAKLLREMLGVPEMSEAALEATEGPERVSEGEAEVDPLIERLPSLGKVRQRGQRLLEIRDRLLVG